MRTGGVYCNWEGTRFRPRFLSFSAKASFLARFCFRYNPEFSRPDQSLFSANRAGCGEILNPSSDESSRATHVRMCNLKSVILLALVLAGVVLFGFGCGRNLGDSLIEGTVIDADTRAPVDSARVYATYIDSSRSSQVRRFVGLTDENGQFSKWTGFHAFDIIEVEKEGYLPARQVVHGGGELLFALEKVAP